MRAPDSRQSGTLYVVGTPIGNLEDITLRALRILREVDFIAAEDTRHTRKLLTHYDIHPKELFSYHEHNERAVSGKIVARLLNGLSGAIVSDAGMPTVSDPGEEVVALAAASGITVSVVPGPSAALAALAGSGLATGQFYFHGFLDREPKKRRSELQVLQDRPETLIFYESPHRLQKMLDDLLAIFGDRRVIVARELTKVHEEYVRGNLLEHRTLLAESQIRGEMVILVEGGTGETKALDAGLTMPVKEHVAVLVQQGMAKKDAMREVARLHNTSRRAVYQALLETDED